MAAKFELSKDHAGKFRFHLKAPNCEIIAASQGYETKANAEQGIERSRRTHPAPRWRTTPAGICRLPLAVPGRWGWRLHQIDRCPG